MVYTKIHSGVIRSIDLKSQTTEKVEVMIPVVEKQSHAALGYDYLSSTLFYADLYNFKIMQKKLSDTKGRVYLDSEVGHIAGIATDWNSRNLYWIDETVKAIYVSSIKDSSVKNLLIYSNLTNPKSIVVSPALG
jgi:hypothetical protein